MTSTGSKAGGKAKASTAPRQCAPKPRSSRPLSKPSSKPPSKPAPKPGRKPARAPDDFDPDAELYEQGDIATPRRDPPYEDGI